MGAPEVIPIPTKSYVAINSHGSDKSIKPTLCDLGRVSNIAAAATLSRTPNYASRNSTTQNTRSIQHRRRPIPEVLGYSNASTPHEKRQTAPAHTNPLNSLDSYAISSGIQGNQSSISASVTPSSTEANSLRNNISTSPAKRIKLESTDTVAASSSTEARTIYEQKSISVPVSQKAQTTPNNSLSANLSQISSQETKAEPHINKHQYSRTHTQNTTQLPNQQAVLLTHVVEKLPTQLSPSIAAQIQQQNQQLRSENMQLQKQLSLFKQLMKNPQRLNQVLARMEQSVH
ncbi:unnamed protein product [Meganyctiphanes norvegica]|uniref:Uncharacterized protein n=1 Tax=Meganyctiphanes norvegica TaxID=48144 RepID=A0AAV2SQV6_MEGNR